MARKKPQVVELTEGELILLRSLVDHHLHVNYGSTTYNVRFGRKLRAKLQAALLATVVS